MRIGVVGVGRIGQMHVHNINTFIDGMEVVAIADIVIDEEWAKSEGIKFMYNDYNELIENDEVDAVLIACSTNLHYPVCMAAAKAKKHVLCEKPIDLDVNNIKEMIKACDEANVKLQVGFNRRFDRNFKKVRDAVHNGCIGDPHIIRIASRDPAPPPIEYIKVSGGIFVDMMIHDFDMIRYLSGSDVEEVYASGNVLIDEEIGKAGDVDTAVVTLKFKNGAIGVIDNSRQAVYGYDQRIEVFGAKGQILAENEKESTVQISTAEGEKRDKIPYFFLERYTQAYLDELQGFYDCVKNDTKPVVDGTDGLRSVQIALAARESLKQGKPIRLED